MLIAAVLVHHEQSEAALIAALVSDARAVGRPHRILLKADRERQPLDIRTVRRRRINVGRRRARAVTREHNATDSTRKRRRSRRSGHKSSKRDNKDEQTASV